MNWHRIILVFLMTHLMQYSNHMVSCVIIDVQLVGGPASNKGTVEVKQDGGDWETTCGINLDINDVIVICRQLGFTGASLAVKITPYGQNSNPLIGLECNGSEGNLSECSTFPPTSGCSSAGSASCHGEGYLGCFVDVSGNRVLSGSMNTSLFMSMSYCIQFCQESTTANYVYAGVEAGYECYCGEASDNYTRHGVGVDSECSFPCHGDPTESCGGSGYIAVFRIHVQTSETTSTIASPWSTEEIQDIITQNKPMTNQPGSEMISGQSTRDDLTSSPIATTFFSTLQGNSHSSCLGVGLGEGVVIIILSVVLIVLLIYIFRIRRMMKDSNKDQKTQHIDLVQSSSSPEKDTGFYHDIQDVMKSDPSTTFDGDGYYSSQIYDQKRANELYPDDTNAPHNSYMI
nr:uncharacterized protein LOC129280032 [Lytechinus pictus]